MFPGAGPDIEGKYLKKGFFFGGGRPKAPLRFCVALFNPKTHRVFFFQFLLILAWEIAHAVKSGSLFAAALKKGAAATITLA